MATAPTSAKLNAPAIMDTRIPKESASQPDKMEPKRLEAWKVITQIPITRPIKRLGVRDCTMVRWVVMAIPPNRPHTAIAQRVSV